MTLPFFDWPSCSPGNSPLKFMAFLLYTRFSIRFTTCPGLPRRQLLSCWRVCWTCPFYSQSCPRMGDKLCGNFNCTEAKHHRLNCSIRMILNIAQLLTAHVPPDSLHTYNTHTHTHTHTRPLCHPAPILAASDAGKSPFHDIVSNPHGVIYCICIIVPYFLLRVTPFK